MARKSAKTLTLELVQEHGLKENDLKNLSAQELADLQKSLSSLENLKEKTDMVAKDEDSAPLMGDPEWSNYVLSLLTDDEKEKDNPKVDGLRRLAYSLLGSFSSHSIVEQAPTIDNAGRATVCVQLVFNDGRNVSGVADVYRGNTAATYAEHAVATAETRAEGRALRKALMLTKVHAAEELYSDDGMNDLNNGQIPDAMLNGLQIMANRIGVNLSKVAINEGYDIVTLTDLNQGQGKNLAKVLGQFQRGEKDIPENVK